MTAHGTYALTTTDVDRLHGLVEGHWSHDQIRLVGQQIAPQATMPELALFLHVAKSRGLDPFARQIYAIHRNVKQRDGSYVAKMTIQVGIDGYRLIADRTGEYVGSDEPIFEERDGKLIKATVTVWRLKHAQRWAFTASARMSEYRQDKSPMWGRMPFNQLAKCAEALALRKAFPEPLSGLYTDAEMDQAGTVEEVRSEIVEPAIERAASDRDVALTQIDELLKGPCADIETEVRDDLKNGADPKRVLKSLRSYTDGPGQQEEKPKREDEQRRDTQAPDDDF